MNRLANETSPYLLLHKDNLVDWYPWGPEALAAAADHIVAQETSLVGSIGVLFQYPNFTEVLKTVGVKVEEIKSSPLKAAPPVPTVYWAEATIGGLGFRGSAAIA